MFFPIFTLARIGTCWMFLLQGRIVTEPALMLLRQRTVMGLRLLHDESDEAQRALILNVATGLPPNLISGVLRNNLGRRFFGMAPRNNLGGWPHPPPIN